jgi:dipeptidase D
MFKKSILLTMLSLLLPSVHAAPVSLQAQETARYALATYPEPLIASLAKMISYNTVADPAVPFADNPQHTGFKRYLAQEAQRLGFDFHDHGHVLIIGMGSGSERVGVITHGDVQPVNPAKWARSPFELDRTSEPGKLLGRGTEDDKGPIATALYAMKAIQDRQVPLSKRIELYVYMAEESDWEPLKQFLTTHTPPQVNITIDAEYPVVTAEKGYGTIKLALPPRTAMPAAGGPLLTSLTGGFFASQIPEDAKAVIARAPAVLEAAIRARAQAQKGMRYTFTRDGTTLTVTALGVSAHSSKPEDGVNAISMLADALAVRPWQGTQAADMLSFLNELVGTGMYGERFGQIAYRDGFMGPMTVAPTVLRQNGGALELNINLRRPQGKTSEQLRQQVLAAFDAWKARRQTPATLDVQIGVPWLQTAAPQIPTLLSVFEHYTGIADPQPVAIGGGTNSRLFPNAVSFGPAMPHTVYTGHSEHEFITEKQLLLNLQMYTAVLIELAK